MGLVARVVDDVRFGIRVLDVGELQQLAETWSTLNSGLTPAEVALRWLGDDDDGDRATS